MLITLNQLKASLVAFKNWVLARIPSKTSDLTNDSGFITAEDETVKDVQVSGTSILDEGVANIPIANANNIGLLGVDTTRGLALSTAGKVSLFNAKSDDIKIGTEAWKPITPVRQHESTFYGLAKAAGHDEKNSTNPVGTYTAEAKTAIQTMLGVPSIADIPTKVSDLVDDSGHYTKPSTGIPASDLASGVVPVQDVRINMGSLLDSEGVANIPIAGTNILGVVKTASMYGISSLSTGMLEISPASSAAIKNSSQPRQPITPTTQHESVFYGLAKIAGHDEKDSTLAVGAYTDEAKTAIKSMLGVEDPVDVQINGTSIVNNGVANIPVASANDLGAVKVASASGLQMINGGIYTNPPDIGLIKNPSSFAGAAYRPVTPMHQHESAFYGLAKAAGDTTQSASSNAVGTYTDEAKAAIKTMLGIDTITVDSIPTTEIDTLFA